MSAALAAAEPGQAYEVGARRVRVCRLYQTLSYATAVLAQ